MDVIQMMQFSGSYARAEDKKFLGRFASNEPHVDYGAVLRFSA
jgi:hypothetical protein